MSGHTVSFRLDAVLAALRPGSVHQLNLTRAERASLHDPDGLLALSVVQHLLVARSRVAAGRRAWEPTPLTAETIRRVAHRLGHKVSEHRCRRMVQRLRDTGVLVEVGSYRGSSGFRVALYSIAGRAGTRVLRTHQASVLRRSKYNATKRGSSWPEWAHPLFGDPSGLPPPGLSKRTLERMRRRSVPGTDVLA